MKLLALALFLAIPPQETVDDLVKMLGAEEIESRSVAEKKLITLGEPAREALTRALAIDDPELKLRLVRILKTLDLHKELRGWFAPPSRITLSGEFTLEGAVREIERQSGQKVRCEAWPEGRFRIELKDAPYWESLEAVCAASGSRSLFARESGPEIGGTKYVKIPCAASGSFNLRFESVVEYRRFALAGASENRSLSLILSLGWERSIAPTKTYLALEEVKDDTGADYLAAFREYEARSFSGGSWFVKDPPPVFMKPLHAGAFATLPEKANRLSARGSVLLWIRGAPDDLEMKVPGPGESAEDAIQILTAQLGDASTARLRLAESARTASSVSFKLSITDMDVRMLRETYELWHLKDKAGRRYVGSVRQVQRTNAFSATYSLEFNSIPADAEISAFVIRIPRRVVALEVPFELKNIPLK